MNRAARVAVYFSGRITGCEDCLGPLCRFVLRHDADVFVSLDRAYDRDAGPDASLESLVRSLGDRLRWLSMRPYEGAWLDARLGALGSGREAVATCPEVGPPGSAFRERIVHNTCAQLYHNRECTLAAQRHAARGGFVYDVVCKLRADALLRSDLPDLSELRLGAAELHVPAGCDHRGLNDQMAIGGMAAMHAYGTLYDALPEYLARDGLPLNAELLLAEHAARCGLSVRRFPLDWELHAGRHDPGHERDLEAARELKSPAS